MDGWLGKGHLATICTAAAKLSLSCMLRIHCRAMHRPLEDRHRIQAQGYPSGLTGVDLFWRPVPWHEVFELGHFMVSDTGEDPS